MRSKIVLSLVACLLTSAIALPPLLAQLSLATAGAVFEISPTADHTTTATTFLVEANGKAEWVTARHVFESVGYPAQTTFFILQGGDWRNAEVSVTYSRVYDLAVMHWPKMPEGSKGFPICEPGTVGYETPFYFLGFPFGKFTDGVSGILSPTVPFMKRAWLAGSQKINSGHNLLVLDAINNYGFSGGPLLHFSAESQPFQACLVGVVSGFLSASEGVTLGGQGTVASVQYNTGLMYAVPAGGITELLGQTLGPSAK